jgi:hypothetical protein
MSFEEAVELMGKDESFRATVYAMNTLLMKKGVYTSAEFERLFCEHAENFRNRFLGKSERETRVSRETVAASS